MAGTKIAECFVAVSAEMGALSAGMRQGQTITTSAVNSMQRTLGGLNSMLGMIGIGVGFGAIVSGIRGTIAEAQTAMDSQTRLAAAVETSGKAAGFTADQLAKFATELQGVTTAGDETIKDAMSTLTTFGKVTGEMFKRATRASLDMQEKGFGGMGGNARMLGRALEDPRRGLMMLTRMSVTFTEAQRAQIKELMAQNKLAEAQEIIMGAVESKFKGVAEAMAKTPSGRIKQLTEATGDLREEIGTKLMPLMVRWKEMQLEITKSVLNFVDAAAPMVSGFADQWNTMNAAASGWLNNGAMVVGVIAATSLAFIGLKWAVTTLILPIVTATAKMVVMTGVMIGRLAIGLTMITTKAVLAAAAFLVELPAAIATASASMAAFGAQTVAATTAALATFGAQLALLWPVVIAFGAAWALVVGTATVALTAFSMSGAWTELERRTTNFKAVWVDAWDKVTSSTMTAFKSIKAAIEVGDIAGAMEVMWAQIQVYWVVGVNAIKNTWLEFQNWLTSNIVTIGEMFTSAILAPIRYIQEGILDVLNLIERMPGGEMMFKVATKMDLKDTKRTAEDLLPSEADVSKKFSDIQDIVDNDRKTALENNKKDELAALDELEDRKAEIHNTAQRKEVAARMKMLADAKAGEGKGAAGSEESAVAGKNKGSPFIGFAELNRKMQEALLKDTVGKQQLDVANEQLGVEKEIRNELKEEDLGQPMPAAAPAMAPMPMPAAAAPVVAPVPPIAPMLAPAAAPAKPAAQAVQPLSRFEQSQKSKRDAYEAEQAAKREAFTASRKPRERAEQPKAQPEMGFRLPWEDNPKRDAAIKERAEREARGAAKGWERDADKTLAEERIRTNREARDEKQAIAEDRADIRRRVMEAERTPEQEQRKPEIDAKLRYQEILRAMSEPPREPGLFMGGATPPKSEAMAAGGQSIKEIVGYLRELFRKPPEEKAAGQDGKGDVKASFEQEQMEKLGTVIGNQIRAAIKPSSPQTILATA